MRFGIIPTINVHTKKVERTNCMPENAAPLNALMSSECRYDVMVLCCDKD